MSISGTGVASIFNNFSRGLQTGRQLKQVRQENELDDVRRKGLEAAKEKRKAEVAGMVKMQGLPTLDASNIVAPEEVQNLPELDASALPSQNMGQPTQPKFGVGDQSFDSKDKATRYAETKAPSHEDIFYKETGPKVYETLVTQGKLEDAQDWQKFMDSRDTRKAMKRFGSMARSAQTGNHEAAIKEFMGIYNSDYANDGAEASGYETKTDDDGNVTGVSVTFKEDGKTWTQDFNNLGDFYQLAYTEMAPEKMFDYFGSRIETDRAARSESAKDSLGHERKKELELMKLALKGDDVGNKYSAKVNILRRAGFSQAQINEMTPKILGAATERAGMSEVDIRAKALAALKDTFEFQGASEAEKQQMMAATVDLIRGSSAGDSPSSPAGGGGGRPVFRDADGNRFVREADGSLRPLGGQPAPAPQQSGAPQPPQASANPAASGLPPQQPGEQAPPPETRQLPPAGPPQIAGRRKPKINQRTEGVGAMANSAGEAIGEQRADVAARARLEEALGPASTRRDLQERAAKADQILSALGNDATPEAIDALVAFAAQEFGEAGLAAFNPTPENLDKLDRFMQARNQTIAQR